MTNSVLRCREDSAHGRDQVRRRAAARMAETAVGGYAALALSGAVLFIGASAMIEMLYQIQLNTTLGSSLPFMGVTLDTHSLASWLGALAIAAVGLVLFVMARRRFAKRWGDVQGEIEAAIRAQEAG